MNEEESNAWSSFVLVVKNFLGNHRVPNYKQLMQNMSIEVHFLHSHLNLFSDNLGHMSVEQGERSH